MDKNTVSLFSRRGVKAFGIFLSILFCSCKQDFLLPLHEHKGSSSSLRGKFLFVYLKRCQNLFFIVAVYWFIPSFLKSGYAKKKKKIAPSFAECCQVSIKICPSKCRGSLRRKAERWNNLRDLEAQIGNRWKRSCHLNKEIDVDSHPLWHRKGNIVSLTKLFLFLVRK